MHLACAKYRAKSWCILSLQSHKERAIFSYILQIKKVRLTEVLNFPQSQTASMKQNWDYNRLNSKLVLFILTCGEEI